MLRQALEHPYMAELHDPDDEPECDAEFDFDYEKKVLPCVGQRFLSGCLGGRLRGFKC